VPVPTVMAHTINRLLRPKSPLHRLVISPFPRLCSQLVQKECLIPKKSHNILNTECNPPKLSQIFKTPRFHRPLNILKRLSNPQKIVQIFKQSAEQPKFRNFRPVYEVTVKKLAWAKQFNAIEEILEHSLQVSEPDSEGFITRIIMLYGVAGMPQHAIKTFNQMKNLNISPTVKSFNALLTALVESKNPKLAHDFYKDIDSFGISANLQTYNIVVKAICKMNEHESAFSFLDEMRKHGCEPDIFTYNTILSALYKKEKDKEADELLGKMSETCPPDVTTYNIRMSKLCGCHKTSEAEKLLDEMISEGLNPDIISFNTLITGFCKDNNLTEAKRIFTDMSSKGCDPNEVSYYTLIYFLSKEGHFDRAYEFCRESMRRNWIPYISTAKMLIDGLVKNNKVENAREVIKGMKKMRPTSYLRSWGNI